MIDARKRLLFHSPSLSICRAPWQESPSTTRPMAGYARNRHLPRHANRVRLGKGPRADPARRLPVDQGEQAAHSSKNPETSPTTPTPPGETNLPPLLIGLAGWQTHGGTTLWLRNGKPVFRPPPRSRKVRKPSPHGGLNRFLGSAILGCTVSSCRQAQPLGTRADRTISGQIRVRPLSELRVREVRHRHPFANSRATCSRLAQSRFSSRAPFLRRFFSTG